MRTVENQFYMQAIVDQQHGVWSFWTATIAHEFFRLPQGVIVDQKRAITDVITADISVARTFDRKSLVQKNARTGDDARAMTSVIGSLRGLHTHGIRAVKGVVETTQPRICSVQGKTGVRDWHNQLRTGDRCNLCIDICCFDLEIISFINQIADFTQESLVFCTIVNLIAMFDVPIVNGGLKIRSFLQQLAIETGHLTNQFGKTGPKKVSLESRARQCLVVDKCS